MAWSVWRDNALSYKYSFGPGCEVEVLFDFCFGMCDLVFHPTTNVLFVADYGSAVIRVLDVVHRTVVPWVRKFTATPPARNQSALAAKLGN